MRAYKFAFYTVMTTVSVAHAEGAVKPADSDTRPESIARDTTGEHLSGLEIMIRPGAGGAGGESPLALQSSPTVRINGDPGALLSGKASPYGVGFSGQAFVGYRFIPLLSAGFRGGYRTSSASSLTDGSTDAARSGWDAGLYIRAYPLAQMKSVRGVFDPWVGTGAEYMSDAQTFKRPLPTTTGGNVVTDQKLSMHSVAIPVGVGADFRVHPMLSVGPSFEYAFTIPVAGCWSTSAPGFVGSSYCSNEDPGKRVLNAKSYGVWTLGLDVKVTLF